ncbi:MAG: hypothetical protein ACLFR1_10665 [Spirochaetia bacterium]
MSDYLSNPEEEYKKTLASIKKMKGILEVTKDADRKKRLAKELSGLKKLRIQLETMYDFSHIDEQEEDVSTAYSSNEDSDYPILDSMWDRYAEKFEDEKEDDLKAILVYLSHFDNEFLSFLSERKLRLDFNHSIERDSFYNSFQQVYKKTTDYQREKRQNIDNSFFKAHEMDLRNRKMKMLRMLYLDIAKYFRKVRRFAGDLLENIEQGGGMCLNPDEKIEISEYESIESLRGLTVKEGIQELYSFCDELLGYLNMPDISEQES